MDIDAKYDHYDFPYEAKEPQNGHAGHLDAGQIAQVHQLRMMLEAEGLTERLDTLTLVCIHVYDVLTTAIRNLGLTIPFSCASYAPASLMSPSPSRCKSFSVQLFRVTRILATCDRLLLTFQS